MFTIHQWGWCSFIIQIAILFKTIWKIFSKQRGETPAIRQATQCNNLYVDILHCPGAAVSIFKSNEENLRSFVDKIWSLALTALTAPEILREGFALSSILIWLRLSQLLIALGNNSERIRIEFVIEGQRSWMEFYLCWLVHSFDRKEEGRNVRGN